ncbi:hypothetical protein J6590_008728 [Homalodisca vitripennis]|nr:hypothetical protein J6590_008728 [Homalodisca vitripennis]
MATGQARVLHNSRGPRESCSPKAVILNKFRRSLHPFTIAFYHAYTWMLADYPWTRICQHLFTSHYNMPSSAIISIPQLSSLALAPFYTRFLPHVLPDVAGNTVSDCPHHADI